MITCKLGDKTYTVDYVTGRALREIEPAAKMYTRISEISEAAVKGETVENPDGLTIPDALDVMIRWFCLLFNKSLPQNRVATTSALPSVHAYVALPQSCPRASISAMTFVCVPKAAFWNPAV